MQHFAVTPRLGYRYFESLHKRQAKKLFIELARLFRIPAPIRVVMQTFNHFWSQLRELLPRRRWRPVASFAVRISVIFCHDLKNKIAPDFIGLPHGIHVGFGLLNRDTFKQDAVQKAKSCSPGIHLAMQQRFFVSITLNRICECVKIIGQRIRKINRDLHVLHPQSFHDLVFVRQRILIIGKRNIDNPLKPLVCNRLQLGFGGLSGAAKTSLY